MNAKNTLALGAISGFLVVAIGAFGAHGLKGVLDEKAFVTYQTGVLYHMFHTLALLLVGVMAVFEERSGNGLAWLTRSSIFFLIGLVLFCGSLYALAISGISLLGMITPFGGVAFLLGWIMLFFASKSMINGN